MLWCCLITTLIILLESTDIAKSSDRIKQLYLFLCNFYVKDLVGGVYCVYLQCKTYRELKEETNLSPYYIEQFHCFTDPNRDPRERVISIAFFALVKIAEVKGGDDAAKAEWFSMDEIPQLAFDHDLILRMALDKLRERIHFQPIGFELLPNKFTLKELQMLYEAILGVNFDRRNFAKKMLYLDILTQLEETVWPTPKRKAYLFSFNREKYDELKQKGFKLEF